MISVGIVGGTGYTGVELLRILLRHPKAQVRVLTSRTEAGKPVADMFPNLRGHTDLQFSDLNIDALKECDVVFLGVKPYLVASVLEEIKVELEGKIVISMAAAAEIKDIETFKE